MSKSDSKIIELRGLIESRISRDRMDFTEMENLPFEQVPFWVVDVETTGGNASDHRIIEIAAIKVREGEMRRVIHTLVNPECSIPYWIQKLTGISNQMIYAAPKSAEVFPWLFSHLKSGIFVAHSAAFDRAFVDWEAKRLGIKTLEMPSLCTVRLSRRLVFDSPGHSLDHLAWYFEQEFGRATGPSSRHRALGDAWVCGKVFLSLLELAQKIGVRTLAELKQLEYMPIKKARRLWKP